ncbi:hypothetical protein [Solirubrobacter soli]|uniref:hypothetical protein n=1 Tax=Solirubrobacter soli TaxID=363832 RepID=UPI001B7FD7E6|nr:hypothetical protein [Solirubrobacter soli]
MAGHSTMPSRSLPTVAMLHCPLYGSVVVAIVPRSPTATHSVFAGQSTSVITRSWIGCE